MHFSQYLLENNIVSEESMQKALLEQRTVRPTVGQLAMDRKWITRQGIFKILIAQNDPHKTGKRFGEIAVDLDLLIMSQVEELVLAQNHPSNFIGEILVKQDALSVSSLIKALSGFNKILKAHKASKAES
ncbi:MAG: hypothetical protein HN472_08290 [Nitrospina sp.]|jgi:hypothetical protein|nr:hypothetical protein [Nitrospina sp.]MBT3509528.1 hypothetical protein [Nitrospina sp.]MBT3877063.1 hypothetical protein [Nitrospina sp.]MBT4558200.1 hypothetical protein [Nitrospina sp.]MBT5653079.1 hypothetical protein [Nitrospina sp.]